MHELPMQVYIKCVFLDFRFQITLIEMDRFWGRPHLLPLSFHATDFLTSSLIGVASKGHVFSTNQRSLLPAKPPSCENMTKVFITIRRKPGGAFAGREMSFVPMVGCENRPFPVFLDLRNPCWLCT